MARLTQPYKNTSAHRQRAMSTESQFNSGMKYTNQPLGDGFAKTLVNFKLHNDGESLTPRGGINKISTTTWDSTIANDIPDVYWTGGVFINAHDNSDAFPAKCVILGYVTADGIRMSDMEVLYTDDDISFHTCTADSSIVTANKYLSMTAPVGSVHGQNTTMAIARKPICSDLNGTLYLMRSGTLCKLTLTYTSSAKTAVKYNITAVSPKEVDPSLTINYGYNMLKTAPYAFANTLTSTGALYAQGVVPYDATDGTTLLLNARPGTSIKFKLIYKYPQTHIANSEKYRVQWEIQDNDAGISPEIVQSWEKSPEYNPGDSIYLECTPTVTNFSLIARMYISSDIADQLEEWDNNENLQSLCKREEFVTPECVTTLASYYICSENANSSKNVEAVTYSLGTAQGMCTWQQRLVLWGVHGAKTTMWVSEINSPDYFPYPNNVEVLGEDIISCVPYLTDMLIFTKSSIYKCKLNEDGLTFTTTRVQDKLNMDVDDSSSVIAVQNMVFFRSDNYYYMVVPNYSYNTGTYGVQLAPISRPVEQLFNNFSKSITQIVNNVYGLSPDLQHYPVQNNLQWYTVYQDGNEIHNIFCVQFVQKETTSAVSSVQLGLFNVHIVYDSVLRSWTIDVEQGDKHVPYVYNNTATGETEFIKIAKSGTTYVLHKYKYDRTKVRDDAIISDELEFQNRQFIDTGNRDFAEDLKKRFREVQFCVNILERGQLKFNTGFIVDDTPEVLPYDWNVEIIDPLTGTLGVSREYKETYDTPEHTVLDTWKLDTDTFPDTTMYKIRYHVCGKGYNGSAQIMADNDIPYELRHISFVYRQMFAR